MVHIQNTQRDGFADFLKFFLIWSVILGHFISPWQTTPGPVGALYSIIYAFHVPLFVFISGYFSSISPKYRKKNIDTLLYPFIVFQLLNLLYFAITKQKPSENNIFYPYHQNWYLIALFWWRTFTPYGQFFSKRVVLIISFLISLGVGFAPEWNGFLGLYKTAYFFPFFVLGLYCDDLKSIIKKMLPYKIAWCCVLAIIVAGLVGLSFNEKAISGINYAFKAGTGYGPQNPILFGVRTGAMITSLIMMCCVLALLNIFYNKVRVNWFHVYGGGTMLAYVGHWFLMEPIQQLLVKTNTVIAFPLCVLSSIVLTWVLTRVCVVNFFRPLLDLSALKERLLKKVN